MVKGAFPSMSWFDTTARHEGHRCTDVRDGPSSNRRTDGWRRGKTCMTFDSPGWSTVALTCVTVCPAENWLYATVRRNASAPTCTRMRGRDDQDIAAALWPNRVQRSVCELTFQCSGVCAHWGVASWAVPLCVDGAFCARLARSHTHSTAIGTVCPSPLPRMRAERIVCSERTRAAVDQSSPAVNPAR
eukprot:6252871-Prymnesium_polylepis.1